MIEFDDTIFHPQGGGQPKDEGYIIYKNQRYMISKAEVDRSTGKVTLRHNLYMEYG